MPPTASDWPKKQCNLPSSDHAPVASRHRHIRAPRKQPLHNMLEHTNGCLPGTVDHNYTTRARRCASLANHYYCILLLPVARVVPTRLWQRYVPARPWRARGLREESDADSVRTALQTLKRDSKASWRKGQWPQAVARWRKSEGLLLFRVYIYI